MIGALPSSGKDSDRSMRLAHLIAIASLLFSTAARAQSADYPRRGSCDKHLGAVCATMIARAGYVAVPSAQIDGSVYGAVELALALDAWDFGLGVGGMFGLGRHDRSLQGVVLELGTRRYLTGDDVAPFVGGGVSPRVYVLDGASFGFAPYLSAGALLNVKQDGKLMVEGRVAQNLLGVDVRDGDVVTDTYPLELAVLAGWSW